MRDTISDQVSVIIPAYNSGQFLQSTIESALSQTHPPLEIIVVDDGSTDDISKYVLTFGAPVKYFRKKNGGTSSARNFGIEKAIGKWVAFLDHDDLWFPQKLEIQLGVVSINPAVDLVFTGYDLKDEVNGIHSRHCFTPRKVRSVFENLLEGNFIGNSTVMAKKESIIKAGKFDQSLHGAQDWDLWLRISNGCEIAWVEQVLATIRHHGTNQGTSSLFFNDGLNIIERYICGIEDLTSRKRIYRRARSFHYKTYGYDLIQRGDFIKAKEMLYNSFVLNPSDWENTYFLFQSLLGPRLHGRIKQLRDLIGNLSISTIRLYRFLRMSKLKKQKRH